MEFSRMVRAFSALGPNEKAEFLARVANRATTEARTAYAPNKNYPDRNYENPDSVILRDANNFVHRVTGYIMVVLDGTEGEGQDASVMEMIAEYFRARRLESHLNKWLKLSN